MKERVVRDAAAKASRVVEAGIQDFWSALDAAAERERPIEYLSPRAVRAVQGWGKNQKRGEE